MGTVILHIHGVVLTAFHHAVLIGVPASVDPAELEGPTGLGPEGAQHFVIAGELPVAVELHQATHLAIGGGKAVVLGARQRQIDAKAHEAIVPGGMAKLSIPHRCGQIAKEERGRLLVIPHVGAAAMAATSLVVTPFKTEKATILGAKAGLRAQVRQIEQGGLFDDG